MNTGHSESDAIVSLDDSEVESILASIGPGPSVAILSLEGDTYEARVGDVVQVLSGSGGFQGTLGYVRAFTDTGRITVSMPANQQIRSYKAKNIRYLCREDDEFGRNFHQQHDTHRWQRLAEGQEHDHEAGSLSDESHGSFHEGAVTSLVGNPLNNCLLPGTVSGATPMLAKDHWIDTPIGAICNIL